MKQFQKIAIGLLGLTHPEIFIPHWKPEEVSAAKNDPSCEHGPSKRHGRPGGRAARAMRALKFMLSALAIGSRTVPLADNSRLRHDLLKSARLLYGSDEG
jgi:hypothetical protein